MASYSSEMKETMVRKLCLPGGPSALQLSKQTGISQTALSRWKREFGSPEPMSKRQSVEWTAEQRLQAVNETGSMNEQELGAYLRKSGLHSTDLDAWKKEIAEAFIASGKKPRGRPRKDPELVAAEEKIKKLERDLRRKEKALAEQTTLVMLQKKAQEIWAKYEDDES